MESKDCLSNALLTVILKCGSNVHSIKILVIFNMKVKVSEDQLCPILCEPMDYNFAGSSVHGEIL